MLKTLEISTSHFQINLALRGKTLRVSWLIYFIVYLICTKRWLNMEEKQKRLLVNMINKIKDFTLCYILSLSI